MANREIPMPTKEELEALRAQGKTIEELADMYFVSKNTLTRWVNYYGIQRKRKIDEYQYFVAERNGITKNLLRQRIYYYNWSVEDAIATPPISAKERCKGRKASET